MNKKNIFSLTGLVLLAALASILLACPTPTDPGTGNNPPTATFPPAGYQVSGAGTPAVNGNYSENGTFNGKAKYTQTAGAYIIFNFWANDDLSRHWGIDLSPPSPENTPINLSSVTYYSGALFNTPPESGWTSGVAGTDPTPTMLRMPISGNKTTIPGTLTGHYTFSDPDVGDFEEATIFQWYNFGSSSTATTGGTPIGTNSDSYTTDPTDNGDWLRVQVTPVDSRGATGTPVLSDPVQVGSS